MPKEHDNFEDSLPPKLSVNLGRIYSQSVSIPSSFDSETLRKSKSVLTRDRRRRRILPWAAIAAVAASIIIAISILRPSSQLALGPAPQPGQRVTILDAYRLAKALSAGQTPSKDWNRTGSQNATQADVDAWARAAVELPQEGRQ